MKWRKHISTLGSLMYAMVSTRPYTYITHFVGTIIRFLSTQIENIKILWKRFWNIYM